MPKAQAEVLANACLDLLNGSKDNLATKDDLNNFEKRLEDNLEHSRQLLEGKIEAVRAEIKQSEQCLRAEIKQSEQRLWIRMLVMQIASVGLIIGALQY